MNDIIVNIISAISIGLIIYVMAQLKSGYLKAIIYSLPIPITVALFSTGGVVNETNIIGLFLLVLFLWSVAYLVKKGVNIYVADVVSAVLYVIVGYFAVTYIEVSFEVSLVVYGIAWLLFALMYKHKVQKSVVTKKKLKPITKFSFVSVMAFILFSLKGYLAGIVVTFPFSGVFAVIESKHTLRTLAATFTRNSIGILAMLATIFYLSDTSLLLKVMAGWASYLVVVAVVSRIFKYAH